MKFALYSRVSKGDLNPDNQKLQLIEYAKQKGWSYECFEEIESSRKTRPIKEQILQSIQMATFNHLLPMQAFQIS